MSAHMESLIAPLSAQIVPLWALQHVPTMVFVFCFGACVGSFINVVNYRLPRGMSVTVPPSRCPTCGARLKFFSENLPIIGWFAIRGRCRYCRAKVSPEYMLVELLMACLFVGLYVLVYIVRPSTPWWGDLGGAWWYFNGPWRTWPVFIALAFLIASLVSMTIIDARTFTIPIQIPLFVTVAAFIAYPLQAVLPFRTYPDMAWPIPMVGWAGSLASFGGMAGILVGLALLRSGKLRYSFADYHEHVPEDQPVGDYPHARREMAVELVFLAPCLVGLAVGLLVGGMMAGTPPLFVQALGSTLAGYLAGGGAIWAIRILGTLAFGREAMGLGDVHLLGAAGAVLGWFDPLVVFFVAPFSGLAWVFVSKGLAVIFRKVRTELPYGPHLAVATLAVILCRPAVDWGWQAIFPTITMPAPPREAAAAGTSSPRPAAPPAPAPTKP